MNKSLSKQVTNMVRNLEESGHKSGQNDENAATRAAARLIRACEIKMRAYNKIKETDKIAFLVENFEYILEKIMIEELEQLISYEDWRRAIFSKLVREEQEKQKERKNEEIQILKAKLRKLEKKEEKRKMKEDLTKNFNKEVKRLRSKKKYCSHKKSTTHSTQECEYLQVPKEVEIEAREYINVIMVEKPDVERREIDLESSDKKQLITSTVNELKEITLEKHEDESVFKRSMSKRPVVSSVREKTEIDVELGSSPESVKKTEETHIVGVEAQNELSIEKQKNKNERIFNCIKNRITVAKKSFWPVINGLGKPPPDSWLAGGGFLRAEEKPPDFNVLKRVHSDLRGLSRNF